MPFPLMIKRQPHLHFTVPMIYSIVSYTQPFCSSSPFWLSILDKQDNHSSKPLMWMLNLSPLAQHGRLTQEMTPFYSSISCKQRLFCQLIMWEIALHCGPYYSTLPSGILWKLIFWNVSGILYLHIFLIKVSSQKKKKNEIVRSWSLWTDTSSWDHCCLFQQFLRLLQEPLQTGRFFFLSLKKN